jgi:hypothetical protein
MDVKSEKVLKDKKKFSLYFKGHAWKEATNENAGENYVVYEHGKVPGIIVIADYVGKSPKYILSSFGKKNLETHDFTSFIEKIKG